MKPGRLGAGVLGWAMAAAAGHAAAALDASVDALVRDGFERPDAALVQLDGLLAAAGANADAQRLVLLGQGSVQAQAGRAAAAGLVAGQLRALAHDGDAGLAEASATLVDALVAEQAGQFGEAAALARPALAAFAAGCPGNAVPTDAAAARRCDHHALWRTLQVLERRAFGLGIFVEAIGYAQAASDLALSAGDTHRRTISLSMLAFYKARNGESAAAAHLIEQARRLAGEAADPVLQARVRINEARVADARGDAAAGLRATEEALALAERAGAPRLVALLHGNLSDAYTRIGRYAQALRAAERALPVVRAHRDERLERLLLHNAALARIGLGRIAEGKADMAQLLGRWERSGDTAIQAETLREFGEALAAAGDARGALDLYHRERALNAQAMSRNRGVALQELQAHHDAEAAQRRLDLLARDNALKTEALANRELMQRLWMLVGALMLATIVLVVLLYRRVRGTQRRLVDKQALLRAQSESDPLTKLANRRHFQAVMALHAADRGFEGAALLVDIDHFKRINDRHGHAAGDAVIVEIARRLDRAVRAGDLVVRWGGEEFLILALKAAAADGIAPIEQIAERVLRGIAEAPIEVEGQALGVTVSVGFARFPLPPQSLAVPWQQALNLADLALYTAKSRGRNRAVGIAAANVADPAALRAIETEFDSAARDGRLTLVQTLGPTAQNAAQAA